MAIRSIRIIGDPAPRTVYDPIAETTPNMKAFVEDLLRGVDMDGRTGLAANQTDVSLRTFSWNIDDETDYVLNPRVVAPSEDECQDDDEGCLSVPELWYLTERTWYARCEDTNLDAEKVVVEDEEFMACCIQRECDHLDGRIYIDHLDRATHKKTLHDIRSAGF